MTKKEKVIKIMAYFKSEYRDADCTLAYQDPFELLVATQLAAQCTDARVNQVTPSLFAKFPDVKAFAEATQTEMEEAIKSTGFYHNKARNLIACAQMLLADFGGRVPSAMDELLSLPGVGRKTANLLLGDAFGQPAIVVDTHAKRITGRLGLTKNTDPTKIEMDLKKIVPPESGSDFCHQLVYHGRKLCIARGPKCALCGLTDICDYYKKTFATSKKQGAKK
ncbi:MAG: endonuclease III [Ruminococcaceae bacterium]|nr:endonuclease III [Oscillospiraceae bacterium]